MEAESSYSRGTGIVSRFSGRTGGGMSTMRSHAASPAGSSAMKHRDMNSSSGTIGKFIKNNDGYNYDQRVSLIGAEKRKKNKRSTTMDFGH